MKRIAWFRRDLRSEDHPLLAFENSVLFPVFIFDPGLLESLPGEDRRVSFIFHHVTFLKQSLKEKGLDLAIFLGKPVDVFEYLASFGFDEIVASGDFDGYALSRDAQIDKITPLRSVQDTYLFSPRELCKQDGSPYKVFTPFYKNLKQMYHEGCHVTYPFIKSPLFAFDYDSLHVIEKGTHTTRKISLESLGFTFQTEIEPILNPCALMETFLDSLPFYAEKRDELPEQYTSRLGVHLRFGTLSIREIVRKLLAWKKEGMETEPFFRQLVWREFFAQILYHFPHSEQYNFQPVDVSWDEDEEKFQRWCRGETGVPIIDAAMCELNSTGHMHNRARMITASFLTKDLHIDWRRGESYFALRLMDYDAASNIASWQWSASTGTDAQPYFRVFNPYLQSKKFDPDARYIKRHLPHLEHLPATLLHNESQLGTESIQGYPRPMIHHKTEAQESIRRFKQAKAL